MFLSFDNLSLSLEFMLQLLTSAYRRTQVCWLYLKGRREKWPRLYSQEIGLQPGAPAIIKHRSKRCQICILSEARSEKKDLKFFSLTNMGRRKRTAHIWSPEALLLFKSDSSQTNFFAENLQLVLMSPQTIWQQHKGFFKQLWDITEQFILLAVL